MLNMFPMENQKTDHILKSLYERRENIVKQIKELQQELGLNYEEFQAPEWCVPIKANVLDFEWDLLADCCQFDVISMDPPWQLASHQPTRGVILVSYRLLLDTNNYQINLLKHYRLKNYKQMGLYLSGLSITNILGLLN